MLFLLLLQVLSAQRGYFPRAPRSLHIPPIGEDLLSPLLSGSFLRGTTRCSRPRTVFSTILWKFSSPSLHLQLFYLKDKGKNL